MYLPRNTHKTYASILVGILISVPILAMLAVPQSAHAIFGIGDVTYIIGSNPVATFAITNPPGASNAFSSDTLKEYLLDLAARIIVGTVIRGLTNQVIGWIQGDDGANVGFVGNLDEAFRKEANLAGGEFLNNLAGIDLCTANLRGYLNISLRTPGLQQRLGCTLSGIGVNAESFFKDFSQGGWPAFLKIGLEPQNNPYGAYLIALDSKLALEDAAGRRIQLGFLAGDSFLGGRGAIRKKEVSTVQVQDADADGNEFMREEQRITSRTEYNTKTPGGLVAQTLAKTVNIGYDFAVVADEINEAIVAIANALITKLVSETYSIARGDDSGEEETGEGLFTSELSELPFGAAELQGHRLVREPDSMMLNADSGLTTADQIVNVTLRTLFITRRQIQEMTASPEPLTPAQQAQLATLRQTEATMEAKLSVILTLKDRLVASTRDILLLKQVFQTAISAEDITQAVERIEQIARTLSVIIQEIEAVDVETTITLPLIPTGDVKQDTATELRNTTIHISTMTSLLREMQSEARRLAAQTASTTPQRKADLEAKSREIDTEVIRLGESRSAIAAALSLLERATTPAEINTAIGGAIDEMRATGDEIKRASALMIAIVPLLKPE
ncbi:MAG: hypothetical protein AAB916_03195 [Patescibacteria group bacterium]